jgi:hypothetical protein
MGKIMGYLTLIGGLIIVAWNLHGLLFFSNLLDKIHTQTFNFNNFVTIMMLIYMGFLIFGLFVTYRGWNNIKGVRTLEKHI